MKILVYGNVYPDSLATNVITTLIDMGHEAYPVNTRLLVYAGEQWIRSLRLVYYANRVFPLVESLSHKAFERTVTASNPDLIIVLRTLPPELVRIAKSRTKARIAFWFPDSIANLGRQYMLSAPYDVVCFKDQYMVNIFREKLGLNTLHLPEACNPKWHRATTLTDTDKALYACDLTVAANIYPYRALMLEPLMDYNLKIWGGDWPRWLESPLRRCHQGRYVAQDEKAKAFRAAKIVVNTLHYSEIHGSNARLFEAAGCGAFQIADWKPSIKDYFEEGSEIVTFRSRQDLRDKIAYYLPREAERREIGDRALARAHREHTFRHRLEVLLRRAFP